jgi:hypothetical protein
MRALRFDHFGDPQVLQVAELVDPITGDGQAVIAVNVASMNPPDAKIVVPATMTTVCKRDTASDTGFQLTDGYHVVRFSSAAAAVPLRPTTIAQQLIDAIRVVGAALHRPPARRHYRERNSRLERFFERTLMAREICRL